MFINNNLNANCSTPVVMSTQGPVPTVTIGQRLTDLNLSMSELCDSLTKIRCAMFGEGEVNPQSQAPNPSSVDQFLYSIDGYLRDARGQVSSILNRL